MATKAPVKTAEEQIAELMAQMAEVNAKNAALASENEALQKSLAAKPKVGKPAIWAAIPTADLAPEDSDLGKIQRLSREHLVDVAGKVLRRMDSAPVADFIMGHCETFAKADGKEIGEFVTAFALTRLVKVRTPKTETAPVVADETVTEEKTEETAA